MFVKKAIVNLHHVSHPRSVLGRILPSACALLMMPHILAASEPTAARTYVDEDYDFKVAAPTTWKRANPAGIAVPGELCRVWSHGTISTIVVFVQKPNRAFSPRFLLDISVKPMKEKLGCEVPEQAVKTIAGMKAMSMVVTGKGTGGALDGKSNIRTSQHWVGVPRKTDIICLLLTAPEADFRSAEQVFQAMLKTLQVGGSQTREQKEAK
jgi:hypothetical protein